MFIFIVADNYSADTAVIQLMISNLTEFKAEDLSGSMLHNTLTSNENYFSVNLTKALHAICCIHIGLRDLARNLLKSKNNIK